MILRSLFSGAQRGTLYRYMDKNRALEAISLDFLPATRMGKSPDLDRLMREKNVGDRKRISFTRDKNFHEFPDRGIGTVNMRFVLDGDSLSNRFPIFSFDDYPYVSSVWDSTSSDRKWVQKNMDQHLNDLSLYDEMEEILILPKGSQGLTGFLKYVKSVDILNGSKLTQKSFRDLLDQCGYGKIPVNEIQV